MCMIRAGFEFRMGLSSYIERVPCDLDHLYDMVIRGSSYDIHSLLLKFFTECIVYFITMSVALMDFFFAKEFIGSGTFCKNTWIASKS